MKFFNLIFPLFIIIFIVAVSTAQSATIHIPADQPTIQAGIDATIAGDTVLVADGIYTGLGNRDIDFGGKGVLLKSENGADFTIIDCQGTESEPHRGFHFHSGEDSTAVVDGFTIQGGNTAGDGGGIYCNFSSPTISNNTISSNSSSRGGGIFCRNNSNPTISNNIISNNTALGPGGGINCFFNSNPIINNNTISNNSALGSGGGIYCKDISNPTISNNTISNNSAFGVGGGIYCKENPTIYNNVISNNSAESGGGIYCLDFSSPSISNNSITGNSANISGGGIYCGDSSSPSISSNTISENSADSSGAGVYCGSFSSPNISNSIIWANIGPEISPERVNSLIITYSDIEGGWPGEGNINANPLFAFVGPNSNNYNICSQSPCIDSGNPSILDPDSTRSDMGVFYPAHPVCSSGNIWYVSVGGSDGAGDGSTGNPFRTIQHTINVSYHLDTVIVENGTYIENINFGGKSILVTSEYIFTGDSLDIHSTIIDGDSVSTVVTIDGSEDSPTGIMGFTIRNGNALEGGGIYCINSNPTIRNNIITLNSASLRGAGIFCVQSGPTISSNTITENSSNNSGGGIYSGSSNPIISNNTISGNSAGGFTGNGGGIYCTSSNATISNNYISRNSASNGGGIFCASSIADISNNTITANFGSGVYLTNSSPAIVNTIIWSNAGIQVDTNNSSLPMITYCCIQDGWTGEGNIDTDPLFVGPFNGNVCFQSPCIDAGDPSILDPDGSRSDIGLFFPDHPGCSFGNIWYVSVGGSNGAGDGTPGNPFRTIQYAVDLSFSGDTVVVDNGTYVENIIVSGKSILLTSNYLYSDDSLDIKNTVIDGDSAFTVITLIGCDSLTVVSGFTITNGNMGGITCTDNSNPTISYNIISRNTSTSLSSGAGISCVTNSNPTISNNIISENTSTSASSGGGISCVNNSNPKIINNSIIKNSASRAGGGIYCLNSSPSIINNIISGNSVSGISFGGGIYCQASSPTISDNAISGNSADDGFGGGIVCGSNSNPVISNNTITGNSAFRGGGISCISSNPSIINSTITDNTAILGCGLSLRTNSSPSVENTVFAFNRGSELIWCNDETSVPTLTCCDVYGNEDGDWVGCIADQADINDNFSADPLFCDTAAGDFHLSNFSQCLAQYSTCGTLIGALDLSCDLGFLCADANGDSLVNVDDVEFLLNFYFYGGATPFPYLASDLNCDGSVNIADITYLAAYINGTGAPPCCAE